MTARSEMNDSTFQQWTCNRSTRTPRTTLGEPVTPPGCGWPRRIRTSCVACEAPGQHYCGDQHLRTTPPNSNGWAPRWQPAGGRCDYAGNNLTGAAQWRSMVGRLGPHDAADECKWDTAHGDARKVRRQPVATSYRRRENNDAKICRQPTHTQWHRRYRSTGSHPGNQRYDASSRRHHCHAGA